MATASRTERIAISPDRDGLSVRLESHSEADHSKHPLLGHELSTQRIFSPSKTYHPHTQIRHLSIYMASESTKILPGDPEVKTGPSGVRVLVEFDPSFSSLSYSDSSSNEKKTKNPLMNEFLSLLQDLTETRILPGPFGLSLKHHRLHRQLECHHHETTSASTYTAHIPLEGAHSMASTESFRDFLTGNKQLYGIFSMASPQTWSKWCLGNAPQSLEDAKNAMLDPSLITINTAARGTQAQTTIDAPSVRRPARWIQWTRDCHPTEDTTDHTDKMSCKYKVSQGIQYTVLLRLQDTQSTLLLSDILPASPFQLDPFSDATYIEVPTDKLAVSFADDRLFVNEFDPIAHYQRYKFLTTSPIAVNFQDVTLQRRRQPQQSTTPTDTTTTTIDEPIERCSLHSRILRDQGQGNTGTLELYLENQCERFQFCSVSVQQSLPLFFSPKWRSLRLILAEQQTIQFRDLDNPSSRIHFYDDGSSRIELQTNATSLRLLLDYDPVLLSIDDFPGDANRGFELPSATATFHCLTTSNTTVLFTLFADTQLILSPLPDMSMPFNVISLTCTFYAFIVGSILNLAIKKASKHVKDKLDPDNAEPDSVLGKIRANVVELFRVIAGKLRRDQHQKQV